ncbi:GNAT family N-acetyltransferase [Blastococcus sp. MG754426]|uniref:GNAT family N-acetyltransferase n=1 Tax=unclassified Blastococcus TaxID=2619396 RepID=UPI001EF0E264|nr:MULTISPECIES: GNAT family N-acetyltransferase [unclassified Blastococcus]MCF6508733.1 GNAT family N-acetyltransferase [Blastococcus sp. MG754426]MCF6513371.1 GNAT family N-acetyltransferase [Blastococcus sp. MG754427]
MPALPAVPDGLTVRPLRPGDAPAVAGLLVAAEALDDTGEFPDADDVAEEWTGWGVDAARDGVAVTDADGALVAYVVVSASPTFRDAYRIHLDGRVHPDRRGRGIGTALLGWEHARGAEVHAERHPEVEARLVVGVPGTQPRLERLVERRGFAAERWYRTMERRLTDLPDGREVPGVEVVPFSWDRDDEVRRAHNAAFTEHHGSSERDAGSWQRLFTGSRAFRPDLSVLAVADGAVAGYVLGYVYEADTRARGYREVVLGQIGVLPGARGRGLASAMIGSSLRAAAAHDCRVAALDVDSDNVTGALRLYESLGFSTVRTRVAWSLSLPPVAAG